MAHPKRIFKKPKDLNKAWLEYKDNLKKEAEKWPKTQYVGKDGDRKTDYPKLPLTLDSFEVYCYNIYGCVGQYFKNKDRLYDDFVPLCAHIRQECKADQITGGLLNVYNPSITQRLNGLVDKSESTIKEEPRVFNLD